MYPHSTFELFYFLQGNSCNIGVIARDPAYLPYIREQLTEEVVSNYFAHAFEVKSRYPEVNQIISSSLVQGKQVVRRYDLPGIHGLNFVLEAALGGGGIASLRPDPQGIIHFYVQILCINLFIFSDIYYIYT